MLKGKTVLIVLAALAVFIVLVMVTHGEGESVLRRLVPALHGGGADR